MVKYRKDNIDAIVQTLTKTGDRRASWEAAGITESTFYEWMSKHSEFSERILEAEKEWQKNLPKAMKKQAQKAFEDYLFGRVVETWKTIDGKRIIVKEINRGVPQWAIERALGRPGDILDAVNILVREGVLPEECLDLITTQLQSNIKVIQDILSGKKPDE